MTDTYCSLPWKHLATHPHGGVTLCCVSDHTKSINRARNYEDGNIDFLDLNANSINEIMNSDYFKEVRLQMLAGEIPQACRRCYYEESQGVRSKRQEENHRLGFTKEQAHSITDVNGEIPVDFEFIELRLGNLCNVRCRTCNPASSTNWASDYKKVFILMPEITKYDFKVDASWTENDEFWDDLLDHSKNLKLIYINGGEPTLVEKHWNYLERLIDRGLNSQITLWYNINMTSIPDKLLDLWKKFKKVQISCSIDDLGKRNDYIRTGTDWKDVVANLDKLQREDWIEVSVCQTISWLNVYYLPEFHDFMSKRGLHVHMNFVHDPAFLSPSQLPDDVKKVVLERCGMLDDWKVNQLRSQLDKRDDPTLFLRGMAYNKNLDSIRGTSFEESFIEWESVLNAKY